MGWSFAGGHVNSSEISIGAKILNQNKNKMISVLAIFTLAFSLLAGLLGCGSSGAGGGPQPENAAKTEQDKPAQTTEPAVPQTPPAQTEVSLKGFGVIREFGGSETAALFGLLSDKGVLKITKCYGPDFLTQVGCHVGTLNQASMDHLFLKSIHPLSAEEKQKILASWSTSQVIYFEGYTGNLCAPGESDKQVRVDGTVDNIPIHVTFQFLAKPTALGDCEFQTFGTILQY